MPKKIDSQDRETNDEAIVIYPEKYKGSKSKMLKHRRSNLKMRKLKVLVKIGLSYLTNWRHVDPSSARRQVCTHQ